MNQFANPNSKTNRFPHAERDLATQYGLAHEHLKALRAEHLKRGTDWELIKSVLCYSDLGRRKISLLLKISGDLPAPRRARRLVLPHGPEIEVPDGVGLFIGSADSAPNSTPGPIETVVALAIYAAATQKKYVEPEPGEVRDLWCAGTVKNHKILRATDGGREAWIRVKDSKNFRSGMTVRAEYVSGSIWTFVGRLPRWPGKY